MTQFHLLSFWKRPADQTIQLNRLFQFGNFILITHCDGSSTFKMFICPAMHFAAGLAVASSLGFAALHFQVGISHGGLWRATTPPPSLLRHPSSSAFEVSMWSWAERRASLLGLRASPDPICSGGAFMWFTPAAWDPADVRSASRAPPRSGPTSWRTAGAGRASAAVTGGAGGAVEEL